MTGYVKLLLVVRQVQRKTIQADPHLAQIDIFSTLLGRFTQCCCSELNTCAPVNSHEAQDLKTLSVHKKTVSFVY